MQPPPVFYPRGSFPPVSNTERQRQFRERNPGYYARIKAAQRARCRAYVAERKAIERFTLALLPPIKPVLMLPAPVEDPMMDALNALAASLKPEAAAREARCAVPISSTRPTHESRAA